MNLKQLIKFGLEESQEPVIKNPVLRSALEKPRSMDQAALVDELEPGELKDEMLGKFNPDQETYEEYLQRINLERPFNMNQGGRIGFKKRGFVSKSGLTKLQIEQKEKTWDTLAEIIQKADIEDDMEYLMKTPESQKSLKKYGKTGKVRFKKGMLDDSLGVAFVKLQNDAAGIKYIADKLGEDTEFVLDIFDEKENFADESRTKTRSEASPTNIKSKKIKRDYDKAEKWLTKNAEKFDDPQKFKKAFIKRFGNNHSFIQAINNNLPSGFSADFNSNILGIKAGGGAGEGASRLTKTLGDNIFSTVIYNFNDDVRKNITNEFKQALSGGPAKVKQEARKILKNSELLKKYNLDKKIHGPISRLIFKEIGEDLYRNIQTFRNPRAGTADLLNYLKDVVDPKYKSQFIDAEKSIKLASAGKIKEAKKLWNINEKIMYDHKIPSSLIDLGYADEIEYIKLSPTIETFNVDIKKRQFDQPMNKLLRRYEKASPENKKVIFEEILETKDKFSKKYGNYLDDVSITADKAGKIKFSSKTPVVTKKTDLVKSLQTNLQSLKKSLQQKNFNNKKLLKFFKDANIPCIKGEGGNCTSIVDYQKGYNQIVDEAANGSKKAIQKLGKFTKGMRALTGAAKWTGYGLLAEAGFMVPFAVGDYAAGKKWSRIIGNATDYGFGPIFGQSEQEEFEAALPKGSAAPQRRNIMELGERLNFLENQTINPQGRTGISKARREESKQKVYDSVLDEYILNMQPFLRPSPHTEQGQFYDQGLMQKAEQEDIDAMNKIKQEDLIRKQLRDIEMPMDFMAAGGGIASIRRPNAIPPESGPTPQGLPSMYNRVKRI